jgi:succinyl-CoA synthetase beta subunit
LREIVDFAHVQVSFCAVQHGTFLLAMSYEPDGQAPRVGGKRVFPSVQRDKVMKIHEYQGKEILRQFGVPVPRGIPAFTVQEAVEAAQKLGGPVWVVKAQIHAGGRGKGGGVKVAKSIEDVQKLSEQILGMQLVTHQTGPEGQKVRRLYIEDGADIKNELYVSLVTDRATQKVALIASSEGGMDIEEVAHSTPEKIITEMIDP